MSTHCFVCDKELVGGEVSIYEEKSYCRSCKDDCFFTCAMCDGLEDVRLLGERGVLLCVPSSLERFDNLTVGIYEVAYRPSQVKSAADKRLLTNHIYGLGNVGGSSAIFLCRSCSHRIKSDVLHNSLGRPVDMDNTCLYCDEPLSPKELELPHRDDDGDLICSRCWWATKDGHGQGEAVPS